MNFLRTLGLAALAGASMLIIFYIGLHLWGAWNDEWSGYNASLEYSTGWCNVAVVPVAGTIVPYGALDGEVNADDVVAALRSAERDEDIEAVLLRIDSGGGYPAASETIEKALLASTLPSVALIRDIGTSGAYLAATGANVIYASEYSDVGSIGVTMSYLDNVIQNEREGLHFVSLSSAPYKDYGNPNESLSKEARNLIERDLSIYHDVFVREVAQNRRIPLEEVKHLADGASMPGELALQNKLIDFLGVQNDTRVWFAERLGVSPDEVVFCE
ncbi:S49 family peptidase [Patescibacteria group bacterium]|nr:S49 family peptidase [Patescibacteria group bacterium]MBU1755083.1 S49 family peptidase [Patescibacteria group bacterium]